MTTTSRLLLLLSLLQARRDWPGQLLADRLDVTDRTVRRDVERLREMGYRIQATKGPDGGYRLDAGSELPPLLFDDDQAIALAVALQYATASGADIGEAAVRALTTVRQVMPSRLRHRVDTLAFTAMPPSQTPGAPVATDVLFALSDAVRAWQVIRFDYQADGIEPGEVPPPRRVEPHHLVASNGRWYLVAWDLDKTDWRIFRADRVTPKTPQGPRFSPRQLPEGTVHGFVASRFKGALRGNTWPCVGTVILHRPAHEVVPFAGDGTVEDLGADQCRYTSGSWSWVALAASIGRFDTAVEVVEPAQLAEGFALLAERFAATHR